jgi:hypothetical protein
MLVLPLIILMLELVLVLGPLSMSIPWIFGPRKLLPCALRVQIRVKVSPTATTAFDCAEN